MSSFARPSVAIALLAAFVALFGPTASVAASLRVPIEDPEPAVRVDLDQNQVFLGDPFNYVVDILNVEPKSAPDLAGFSDFEVDAAGDYSMNRSSTFVINNKVTRHDELAHRYAYRLTAKTSGTVTIPAPVYRQDGKEYKGEAKTITVVGPEPQEVVKFGSRIEREGRYPLQPFTATLLVFVKKLPPPNDRLDPVNALSGPDSPALRIPWVKPPDGVDGEPLDSWLAPLRARSNERGFTINDLTFQSGDPFEMFGGPRVARFRLDGRPATDAEAKGVPGVEGHVDDFFVYRLTRKFEPRRAGHFEFGASAIRGEFATGVKNGRQPITKAIFDSGAAFSVDVDEAPAENRPTSWSGAFGSRFTVEAVVDPSRARVGDPLNFTVKVKGDGNVEAFGAPDIGALPGFAGAFAVEKSGGDWKNSTRTFNYVLRASSESVKEIPGVEISFFDVRSNRYSQVSSPPIPIKIEPISSLAARDIVSANPGKGGPEIARADGLFGNRVDPSEVRDERVSSDVVFLGVGGLTLLYVVLSIVLVVRERILSDPRRVRRRTAAKRARERFARAEAATSDPSGVGGNSALEMQAALLGLLADAAALPESGMTGREATKLLIAAEAPPETVAAFDDVMTKIDHLRFGGGAVDTAMTERARSVLEAVIGVLERGGRLK